MLHALGFLLWSQGDYAEARQRLSESVSIFRTQSNKAGLGFALTILSQVALAQGDQASMRALAEESVLLLRETDQRWGLAISLVDLGNILRTQEGDAAANVLYEESVTLLRGLGDTWALTMPLRHLGDAAFRQGDYVQAEKFYREGLILCQDLSEKWFTSRCLENLAGAVSMQGHASQAARLFGAAEALRETIMAPVMAFYRAQYDRNVAATRARMDEESFAAAWAEGRAMPLSQVFAYALAERSRSKARETRPATMVSEVKVEPALRLFALGPTEVYRGEHRLESTDWTFAKPRELLFYLLCHDSSTRGQIGLALWPDASPAQLRSSFHVTVHHLRQALGRPEWIVFEHQRYAFNRHLPYWFDVEIFEERLAQARHFQASAPIEALSLLEEAIRLYQGDFLQDMLSGEWHVARREALRRLFVDALLMRGHLLFAQDHYPEATAAYRQTLVHEPYLEAAHRALMLCLARLGERNQALRHYQTLVEMLHDSLGSAPAPETMALFESLRRGEPI